MTGADAALTVAIIVFAFLMMFPGAILALRDALHERRRRALRRNDRR